MYGSPFRPLFRAATGQSSSFPFSDFRLTAHYPAKSRWTTSFVWYSLARIEYVTEKYAFEIMPLLDEWSRGLKATPPAAAVVAKFLDASIEATSLRQPRKLNCGRGPASKSFADALRPMWSLAAHLAEKRFLAEIKNYLAGMSQVETAEFEIVAIEETAGPAPAVNITIHYDFVGTRPDMGREERVGQWRTRWSRPMSGRVPTKYSES